MTLIQWLFWMAIILGAIAWLFIHFANGTTYPEVSFWEIHFVDHEKDIILCTCCCKIELIVRIIDGLNEQTFVGKYYYKRTG